MPSDEQQTRVRVLVVDDVAATRQLIAELLASADHAVEMAATGAEAVTKARRRAYDVVILDLGLPDGDGLDVCREIRSFSEAYIIIVTGRTNEADRLRGLAGGADDYVVKPFFPAELALRVEAVLRRPRTIVADDSVVAGDVRLSRSTREVSVGGRPVSLTRIEFALLEILAGRAGRVASRQELAEVCWGPAWGGEDRLLTVHMGNLRKKVDVEGARLVTVRGVGYRLVDSAVSRV